MHRIDTSTAQKDKFGTGKNGFTSGNPQTGELATALDADYFDDLQEEICNLIEAAGISLVKSTRTQLLSAIKQLPKLSNLNFYADSGSANSLIIKPSPAITELVDGQVFDISCAAANTGAVTLKVNALSAYPVIGSTGALQGGEIGAAKGVIRVVWSSAKSSFLLVAQNTTGPTPVSPATQSNHAVNLGQFPALISDAGYQKLPNGLIIQWGVTGNSNASTGVATATFPIAFPTACLNVSLTEQTTVTGTAPHSGVNCWGLNTALTTSGFTATCAARLSNAAAASETAKFIAIGY